MLLGKYEDSFMWFFRDATDLGNDQLWIFRELPHAKRPANFIQKVRSEGRKNANAVARAQIANQTSTSILLAQARARLGLTQAQTRESDWSGTSGLSLNSARFNVDQVRAHAALRTPRDAANPAVRAAGVGHAMPASASADAGASASGDGGFEGMSCRKVCHLQDKKAELNRHFLKKVEVGQNVLIGTAVLTPGTPMQPGCVVSVDEKHDQCLIRMRDGGYSRWIMSNSIFIWPNDPVLQNIGVPLAGGRPRIQAAPAAATAAATRSTSRSGSRSGSGSGSGSGSVGETESGGLTEGGGGRGKKRRKTTTGESSTTSALSLASSSSSSLPPAAAGRRGGPAAEAPCAVPVSRCGLELLWTCFIVFEPRRWELHCTSPDVAFEFAKQLNKRAEKLEEVLRLMCATGGGGRGRSGSARRERGRAMSLDAEVEKAAVQQELQEVRHLSGNIHQVVIETKLLHRARLLQRAKGQFGL